MRGPLWRGAGGHCPPARVQGQRPWGGPAGVQGQSPWGEILCGDMCGAKARFARSEAQGKADPCLRPPAKSADFEAESPFTGGQSHPVNASKGAGF